jgi:hypothetical protein
MENHMQSYAKGLIAHRIAYICDRPDSASRLRNPIMHKKQPAMPERKRPEPRRMRDVWSPVAAPLTGGSTELPGLRDRGAPTTEAPQTAPIAAE